MLHNIQETSIVKLMTSNVGDTFSPKKNGLNFFDFFLHLKNPKGIISLSFKFQENPLNE